jgi:hypothetical protein
VYATTIAYGKQTFRRTKVRDLTAAGVRRFLDTIRAANRRDTKTNGEQPREVSPATVAKHLRQLRPGDPRERFKPSFMRKRGVATSALDSYVLASEKWRSERAAKKAAKKKRKAEAGSARRDRQLAPAGRPAGERRPRAAGRVQQGDPGGACTIALPELHCGAWVRVSALRRDSWQRSAACFRCRLSLRSRTSRQGNRTTAGHIVRRQLRGDIPGHECEGS